MVATMERELVPSPTVLMFPWLAYGHIYPFLEVAKKLTDTGFNTYLCSTSVNLDSVKNKITDEYSRSIHLLEIQLPESPELPSSHHTTNGLPPHLMSLLRKSLYKAKPQLSTMLDTLKPDLVVYDIVLTWAATLCARHNIPAVKFSTTSAVALSYFVHMVKRPGQEYPFPAICLSNFHLVRAHKNRDSTTKDIKDENPEDEPPTGTEKRHCDQIIVIKGSSACEEKYINYLSDVFGGEILPFCPLSRDPVGEDQQSDDEKLIHWLDDKAELSCVFVSFGSEYFLNKEEMEEIALGLELSNVNFIWVLRFPMGTAATAMEESLPEGFLERVKGRGKVLVQGWAPQARILRHPSIGGFLCHCGWNSIMESIEIGVPIIAVPMNLDQPINARFAIELGVAVEVTADEKNGTLGRETIAEVIKDVVVGKAGEELRKNAIEIGEKLKARENEDFDALATTLKQLCQNNNLAN